MPHYKYLGSDERTLAHVGLLKPGQIFPVDERIAFLLDAHAPETYQRVTEEVAPVIEPEPASVEPAPVLAPEAPIALVPVSEPNVPPTSTSPAK